MLFSLGSKNILLLLYTKAFKTFRAILISILILVHYNLNS
jgi:hypothetical protein